MWSKIGNLLEIPLQSGLDRIVSALFVPSYNLAWYSEIVVRFYRLFLEPRVILKNSSEVLADVISQVSLKQVSSYVSQNKRSSEAGSKKNGVWIEGAKWGWKDSVRLEVWSTLEASLRLEVLLTLEIWVTLEASVRLERLLRLDLEWRCKFWWGCKHLSRFAPTSQSVNWPTGEPAKRLTGQLAK